MPSSIRLTTTESGMALVRPRYDMVAMPKANAIGTPMPTQAATMHDEEHDQAAEAHGEQQRLADPQQRRDAADGDQRQAEAAQVVVSSRRSSEMIAASAMPTRMATTR